MSAPREVDLILLEDLRALKLGPVCEEFRFDQQRKWRFDFCIIKVRLAAEIEGAIWTQGRHTRGKGYQGDLEKYNSALVLGWRVFRFSTQDVLKGEARHFLNLWREAHA